MFRRGYIHNFSQALLFLMGLMYFINYLMGGRLSELFMLQPSRVVNNLEFWRIVTFPLAPSTLEGLLLFIFTFWVISPKVEEILYRGIYPLILASFTCLLGTVITLIFWKSPLKFFGTDGITFFVLTFFGFIQFNKRIVFWKFQPIKVLVFISLVSFTWLAVVFIHGYTLDRGILISSIFSAMFGVIVSFVLYLQIKIIYRMRNPKQIEIPKFVLPDSDEMSLAMLPKTDKAVYGKNSSEDTSNPDFEIPLNEESLNEILDKINEKGKDSLSSNEVRFLKEYSKKLT